MPLPLMAILAGAGGLANVFGGAAKGMAGDRNLANATQAQTYNTQQQTELDLLRQREAAVQDRANRALTAPAQRTRQAVIAQMLANYRPTSVSGLPAGVSIPQTSGGALSALMGSPQAKQSLELLTRQALLAQLTGSDVPDLPDTAGARVKAPGYQKAGRLESILSGMGLIGGAAGAFAGMRGGGGGGGGSAVAPTPPGWTIPRVGFGG